jgi:hypothetical protein
VAAFCNWVVPRLAGLAASKIGPLAPGHCHCIRDGFFPPNDQRESLENANSAQNGKTVHNLKGELSGRAFFPWIEFEVDIQGR